MTPCPFREVVSGGDNRHGAEKIRLWLVLAHYMSSVTFDNTGNHEYAEAETASSKEIEA